MRNHISREYESRNIVKERDKIGVWGFGNVSRDVVIFLVDEGLGKEIVFYGRPKKGYPDRAGTWIEDLKANSVRRPPHDGYQPDNRYGRIGRYIHWGWSTANARSEPS